MNERKGKRSQCIDTLVPMVHILPGGGSLAVPMGGPKAVYMGIISVSGGPYRSTSADLVYYIGRVVYDCLLIMYIERLYWYVSED